MSFFTLYVSVLGTIFVLNAIVNTLLKCYEISTRCEPKPQKTSAEVLSPNGQTASSYEHENENKGQGLEEQIPENIHKSMYS